MKKIVTKKFPRTTVSLSPTADRIRKVHEKFSGYGWFSRWVTKKLIEEFKPDKKILISVLNDKQKQRDKLEEEIKHLAKQIKKLK